MVNVKKLSEIEAAPVKRNRTWFPELDKLYGTSDIEGFSVGMPKGKISLWAGQSGVGKSRLCIEVAKKFSTNYINGVVLYFQTESPLSDFASWAKDNTQYDKIYCSGENKIDEMIKIIYQVKPKLIFIDSVNEVDEFEIGNKSEARRLIQGTDSKPGFKKVAHDVDAHLILLGQLNQDGKTIKGGTSLPHLVDIALNVVNTDMQGVFRVEVGTKHRYGSREGYADFRHTNDGVIEYKPAQVDPKDEPSEYFGETSLSEPFYSGNDLWTVRKQEHYLKTKAQAVINGEIKVNEDGNIIPKKNRKGLLKTLNEGVGRFFGLNN